MCGEQPLDVRLLLRTPNETGQRDWQVVGSRLYGGEPRCWRIRVGIDPRRLSPRELHKRFALSRWHSELRGQDFGQLPGGAQFAGFELADRAFGAAGA